MKIALILLPSWSTRTPPLGLAMISSALKRAGHQVKCFDFNVRLWNKFKHEASDPWNYQNVQAWEQEFFFEGTLYPKLGKAMEKMMEEVLDWKPDLAGFSIYSTGINCTRRGAEYIRKRSPSTKVIYGGPEVTRPMLEKKRDFEFGLIDAAVIGEGENTVLDLVKRLELGEPLTGCQGIAHKLDGKVIFEPTRPNLALEELPLPDFTDFDFTLYEKKALPIMMSRGCVAKCTFCAETRFWKGFRFRNPSAIFDEFMQNVSRHEIRNFEMADSLINGNFAVLEELTEKIISSGEKITWGGYARLDKRMTPILLGMLVKSGLNFLNFGLETGSQKIMDLMEKRTTVEDCSEVIRNSYRFGIMVSVNIIVGFPQETEEDFQETIDFIKSHREEIFVVSTGTTLWVTHGTPLDVNPEKFGIKSLNGRAFIDRWGHWVSEDGLNTAEVRFDRLKRLQNFLDEEGIFWVPSGNNPRAPLEPVDVDVVLAKIEAQKCN